MRIIDLIEALQEQIKFCQEQKRYRCGIYVTTQVKREMVNEILENILPSYRVQKLVISRFHTEAIFTNGNSIEVVNADDTARGYRFNGSIIDDETDEETYNCVILPKIMPLHRDDGWYDDNDNPANRLYTVNISQDDVSKSEEYKNCCIK